MTSIFEHAMGADFARLHPMLQRRFSVGLDGGHACTGRGVMTEIRQGPWWTVPFLQIGRLRNILVPDTGSGIPFVIENYPYLDPFGRETVTFVREYNVRGHRRRFDATMVLHAGRTRSPETHTPRAAYVITRRRSALRQSQEEFLEFVRSQ